MTRYKGKQSAKAVEKDFPHFVGTVVLLGGLGNGLDAMYEFRSVVMVDTTPMVQLFGGASPVRK